MCLLITFAILVASYNFYANGYLAQAIMSAVVAGVFLSAFLYRLITNGKCIFGKSKKC